MGRPERAIGALQHLDSNEQSDGRWAFQLTKLYQRKGDLNAAAAAAKRALQRQPYNGTYRELAATIALQRGDMDVALHHITGLSLLEPDHAIHQVRLAALYHRLGRADDANNAAQAALKLDADAPVQKFLSDE